MWKSNLLDIFHIKVYSIHTAAAQLEESAVFSPGGDFPPFSRIGLFESFN